MFLARSGAIEGYEKLVQSLGGNPMQLFARVGLVAAQMGNPNNYFAYSKMAELLEISATEFNQPFFGLRLSQSQTSSILGDMTLSLFQQPTVQDALDSVSKYLFLHARGAHLTQKREGENTLVSLAIDVKSSYGLSQIMQLSVGQLSNFVAETVNLKNPGFGILLQQPQPSAREIPLTARFLSRVSFNSQVDGIRIASAWLGGKPHIDEQALRAHLDHYIDSIEQRYPDKLQDQVKGIIGQLLPCGECDVEKVASTLGLQARVLQQRLQQQGFSYGSLLREARREIAEQHLRYRSMAITELAFKLGYAEVSVFSRSFKQWTGLSPRQWQQRHTQ